VGDSAPFTPSTFAYPLNTREGYRQNLQLIREKALQRNNKPFWNYFNTLPYQSHRDPSFGELCWQVFTSLTFGAKGVLYFTYWDDPDGQHYGAGNAIITRRALPGTYNASNANQHGGSRADYVKGPHWYDAKRINSIVLAYGKLLFEPDYELVSIRRQQCHRADRHERTGCGRRDW
jgi:hypothetical protein